MERKRYQIDTENYKFVVYDDEPSIVERHEKDNCGNVKKLSSGEVEKILLTHHQSKLLLLLLINDGGVVSKSTIMQEVWEKKIVTDNSMRQVILALRKNLDDSIKPYKVIINIPRVGYYIRLAQSIDTESIITKADPPSRCKLFVKRLSKLFSSL